MAADRYRALFESMADPAFVLDEEGRILEVNQAAASMYGYARSEMVGLGIADWSAEPEESAKMMNEAEFHVHHRLHRRKDGTVFPVEVRASSFVFEGRKTFVGVARDITERVRAEAATAERERLASTGLLAASLGHELNNPLAYVLFNVDALGQELSTFAEVGKRCAARRTIGEDGESHCAILESSAFVAAVESVGDAVGGLRRIGEITRRLPALSKVEAPRSEPPRPDAVVPTPSAAASQVRGRLLVVDDEEPIRRMLTRLLGRDHDVVIASSGLEARTLLEADRAFDVVLSDLMMPDMSGMDLHAWLLTVDVVLARHLVFMSGGAFVPSAAAYLAGVENPRVDKPFAAADLKRLVAELVLAARSEPRRRA